jgi:hypothetical protein
MKVNKYLMPAIMIVVLLGVFGLAQLNGSWVATAASKTVSAGELAPADIKGFMTLQQVADGLSVPLATVYELAKVPDGANVTPATALKDLEAVVPGFGVPAFRDAVTAYLASR